MPDSIDIIVLSATFVFNKSNFILSLVAGLFYYLWFHQCHAGYHFGCDSSRTCSRLFWDTLLGGISGKCNVHNRYQETNTGEKKKYFMCLTEMAKKAVAYHM